MASPRRITKTTVDRLQPGETAWDSEVRGFCVRKQRRDAVYALKYRAGGKQRLYTIGLHGSPWTVEKARNEAVRLRGAIADGVDPALLREAMKAAPSFDEFADRYLSEVSDVHKKATTAREDRRMLKLHARPRFDGRKVSDIDRGDVARLHAALKSKPVMANRVVALISHMLNYAMEKGVRPEGPNPCQRIKRYAEESQERFLTVDELARLGAAIALAESSGIQWEPDPAKKVKHAPKPENRLAKIDQFAAGALRLLLFTGARLREVLHLKWEHIDFDRGLLLLPDSKTGKKAIVLNAPALAVLNGLERVGEYVIAGEKLDKPRADLKRPWNLVRGAAGLDGLRIHDLRHTYASFGAGGGLGLPIIGKLLGHSQAATTARYAHLDSDPLKRASETIAGQIAAAMSPDATSADVVPFKRPAAT
ncbi:integrase [Bradyrhizobium diazoefficiens]|uniref:tyrosine-type recombinase/integrase n=1 Tax=Bradyrhizobium diazoefficiens TaxID=1355477 RepID=UPI00351340A9